MNKKIKFIVSFLLVLSALMLGVLVPGGPIETRSFSNYSPLILSVFNVFLTTLGLFSFALVYFVLREKRWALIASAVCGAGYLAVYLLDLCKIFPVSMDKMPVMLMFIEISGSLVSLPLMLISIQSAGKILVNNNSLTLNHKRLVLVIGLLVLVGTLIVIFATNAAMH